MYKTHKTSAYPVREKTPSTRTRKAPDSYPSGASYLTCPHYILYLLQVYTSIKFSMFFKKTGTQASIVCSFACFPTKFSTA